MEKIFKIVQNDQTEVRREGLWVFSNATHNAFLDDIVDLVKIGWMNLIIQNLETEDVQTLEICCEALNTMFQLGLTNLNPEGKNEFAMEFEKRGGLDKLESLQHHN